MTADVITASDAAGVSSRLIVLEEKHAVDLSCMPRRKV